MNRLILTLIATSAIFAASGREYGGRLNDRISWTLQDSVLTVSGTGAMPSYTTTDWMRNPFMDERMALGVHTIIIEEGITEIGSFAFGQRADVRNSRINREGAKGAFAPTQSDEVGNGTALYANLRRIDLPQSLRKIAHHAFTRVPVRNILLHDSIETIGAAAFANSGLRSVRLPAGLKHIGPEAFLQCINLIGVDLNNVNVALGTGVFFNCEQLQLICHTQNIRDIAPSTFDATRLTGGTPEFLLEKFSHDGLQYALDQGMTASEYYKSDAENLTSILLLDDLRLMPYDSESGTCRLETVCHGNFLIALTPAQAESLHANWREIYFACQPSFRPRKGKLILQNIIFILPDETKVIAAPIPQ